METTPKSRPWFVLLPIALLFIMIMIPYIRTLMGTQLRLIFQSPHAYAWALRERGVKAEQLPESDPGEEQRALQSLASANPQDYQIQLAYSLLAEWSHAENTPDDRVKRLDALAGVFPARATVYAHMLRYQTEREVKVRRQAEFESYVNQTPQDEIKVDPDEVRPPADLSKRLEEFERYAVAGEKLEPDNAYFSMMRAVGLFASKDDKLAVECIKSAAAKHHWDDYLSDELEADWKLGSMAFGDRSAALRAAIQGGVGSPHLVQLAAVGRTAAALSIRWELDGKIDDAITLRTAMARCGGLMRSRSHTIPGAITGANIVYEQIYRPGGAPLIIEDVNFSKAEREQQRLDAYFSYLTKHGKADEANWMRNEIRTDALVKVIQAGAAEASLSPYGRHGARVASWWMLDCVLLTNSLYLLIPSLLIVPIAARKKVKSSSVTLVLVGAYALAFALAWIAQWAQAMTALRTVFAQWVVRNSGGASITRMPALTDRIFDPNNLHMAVIGLAMFGPIVLLAILYRSSRKTNIVFVDTIRLEFAHLGAIFACICLLLYGVAVTKTSQHDTQLHVELDKVIINEGKYEAPMIGMKWPD